MGDAHVKFIMLATLFFVPWLKIVMQRFLVAYHGIPTCHMYFHSLNEHDSCVCLKNTSESWGISIRRLTTKKRRFVFPMQKSLQFQKFALYTTFDLKEGASLSL